MAQSVRGPARLQEAPPIDPSAVARAYRLHRARRYARVEHNRARRLAGLRFLAVLFLLTVACAFLVLAILQQIQRLFGL